MMEKMSRPFNRKRNGFDTETGSCYDGEAIWSFPGLDSSCLGCCFTGKMTLDQALNPSKSWFPHLENEENHIYLIGLLSGLK